MFLVILHLYNPFLGQRQPPPPPVKVDSEDEYRMDDVLDSRLVGGWRKLQCLVKWTGYDHPTSTWEDTAGVDGLQASTASMLCARTSRAPRQCRRDYTWTPSASPELGRLRGGYCHGPGLGPDAGRPGNTATCLANDEDLALATPRVFS